MWYTNSWQQLTIVGVLQVSSSSSMPSFAFGDVHVGGNESRSKTLTPRYVYSVLCFIKATRFELATLSVAWQDFKNMTPSEFVSAHRHKY